MDKEALQILFGAPLLSVAGIALIAIAFSLIYNARNRSKEIDQETERAKAEANRAESEQKRNADNIQIYAQQASAVMQLAEAVHASIEAQQNQYQKTHDDIDRLVQKLDETLQANEIGLDAANASRKQLHGKIDDLGKQVAENFKVINGVNTTMLEICQRIETLQNTIQDADVSKRLDKLQTDFGEVQKMIAEKRKKSTDESPAAPAPEGGA